MLDRACLGAFEKIAACAGGTGAGGCFDVFLPRPFEERMGVRSWGVGCAAGRDVRPAAQSLSFVSPKESNQRKRTPLAASLRFAAGNLRCSRTGCAAELASRLRACLRQPQRVRSRSAACCAAAPAPRPALLDTARGEVKSPRAIAALGLDDRVWERACPRWGLCSSDALIAGKPAPTRQEQNPGPSAAMARVVVSLPSGCAEERSGRGERVHRRMHPHRDLTRWRCLNGALQARSEFDSAPRP